jgi:hypothetical protein
MLLPAAGGKVSEDVAAAGLLARWLAPALAENCIAEFVTEYNLVCEVASVAGHPLAAHGKRLTAFHLAADTTSPAQSAACSSASAAPLGRAALSVATSSPHAPLQWRDVSP